MRRFAKAVCTVVALAVAAVAVVPGTGRAQPYAEVVFFGDSLTDAGNVSAVTLGLIPGAPYFDGRFSNGPIYADVLSMGLLGEPNRPLLGGGTNYAFAGARIDSHPFALPSVMSQVDLHLILNGGVADSQDLHVLWAGGNDILDAASAALRAPAPIDVGAAAVSEALQNIGTMVYELYLAGARSVLVPNLPDLGLTPESIGEGSSAYASLFTGAFNFYLDLWLDALDTALVDLELTAFDTFATLEDALAAGAFDVISEPCLTNSGPFYLGGGDVCADPDRYLFWDDIHPTARAHQLLGEAMLDALAAAPPSFVSSAAAFDGAGPADPSLAAFSAAAPTRASLAAFGGAAASVGEPASGTLFALGLLLLLALGGRAAGLRPGHGLGGANRRA